MPIAFNRSGFAVALSFGAVGAAIGGSPTVCFPVVSTPLAPGTFRFYLDDVSGDGIEDLITVSSGEIRLASGLPGGGFGSVSDVFQFDSLPVSVATGDLNGDALTDLISANLVLSSSGELAVLLNNGEGGFDLQASGPAFLRPYDIDLADFDNDGDLDAVIATRSGRLLVAFNSGSGDFSDRIEISILYTPFSVSAFDVDADGLIDIVAGCDDSGSDPESLRVFRNVGGRVFSPLSVLPLPMTPLQMEAVDHDGDGDTDLVTPVALETGDPGVSILENDGNGVFVQVGTPTSSFISMLAVGDVNSDGAPDVVYSGFGPDGGVLINNGSGAYPIDLSVDALAGATDVGVLDNTGDGFPDLLAIAPGDSLITLENLGNNEFESFVTTTTAPDLRSLLITDLNGDDVPDSITAHFLDDVVEVGFGTGSGDFVPQQLLLAGDGPVDIEAADLDGDGDRDAVVLHSRDRTVLPLLNDGSGVLVAAFPIQVPGGEHLVLADLDGDGDHDIAATSTQDAMLWTLLNDGTGDFASLIEVAVPGEPGGIVAGDFDKDGLIDLAIANRVFRNVDLLHGNGSGDFDGPLTIQTNFTPRSATGSDIDGDGLPDLVVGVEDLFGFYVVRSPASGGAQLEGPFPTVLEPIRTELLDIDDDGDRDLIVASAASTRGGGVAIHLNDGAGNFGVPVIYANSVSFFRDLVVADFNTDGKPDLALPSAVRDSVSVLVNNGDGTLAPEQTTQLGFEPAAVDAADLDGDGDPDLAVLRAFGLRIELLRNDGGQMSAWQSIAVPQTTTAMTLGDFDQDGDPDLVVAAGGTLGIWSNEGAGVFIEGPTTVLEDDVLRLVAIDAEGDGVIDLAAVSVFPQRVFLLRNDGAATFSRVGEFAADQEIYDLRTDDIDGDGNPDLTCVDSRSGKVYSYLNRGDGSFAAADSIGITGRPAELGVADFNADQRPDLVALQPRVNAMLGQVEILTNLGEGNWSVGGPLLVDRGPVRMAVGDFDDDGDPDLAVSTDNVAGDTGRPGVSLLFNSAGVINDEETILAGSAQPGALVAADVDQDQRMDIGVVLSHSRIAVYLNQCEGDGCGVADLAEPFGVLDLSDITAFVSGFLVQDPISDLDGSGVFDLGDITLFVTSFVAPCP